MFLPNLPAIPFVRISLLSLLVIFTISCGGGGGSNDGDGGDDSNTESDVATLSSLIVSAGDYSPTFEIDTTSYTLEVANDTDSTTVTATVTDANAGITIDGNAVDSGSASSAILLDVGSNVIAIVVTAEDGETTRTYNVEITRLPVPNTDASLLSLVVSAGDVDPVFDTAILDYDLSVVDAVTSTTITATVNEANAGLTINGASVNSGEASSAISLAAGENVISVLVTAQDGINTRSYTVTIRRAPASFELIDPTAAAGNIFGKNLVILPNGNIVIAVPDDSSVVSNNGAVHLFNPYTQTVVASFYGDEINDYVGSNGTGADLITVLANGNFVIGSSSDSVSGIDNAGSVILINAATGDAIGSPIVGDLLSDQLGSSGIVALNNGNYVILSPNDDLNAINGGSVILVDGETGIPIGSAIGGAFLGDNLGVSGVTPLENGNYVTGTSSANTASLSDAGSVILVNGETGDQIGTTIFGTSNNDGLGSRGIRDLENGNFVVASSNFDDPSGEADAGSIMLIDGSTGTVINNIVGDNNGDRFGLDGVTVLSNGNYVVGSSDDDILAVTDGGSVMLVDGDTGIEIDRVSGDTSNDSLGSNPGITALSNGNYIIAASVDDVGGNTNAGSVRLMNGSTGAEINRVEGDSANDSIGLNGITELSNGNYVIASAADDVLSNNNEGSVKLMNGSTGALINEFFGDANNDNIGSDGVTALPNGNYVVVSRLDNNPSGTGNEGSIMLFEGIGGTQVGSTIFGDLPDDFLGYDADAAIALSNNNVVVISEEDNEPSITDAGSMILIDGDTGIQIDKITGSATGDFSVVPTVDNIVTESPFGDFFILSTSNTDNVAGVDSGKVLLITQ